MVRKALYKILLYDKSKGALGYTTKFNFKYIPSLERPSTGRGSAPPASKKLGRIERTALISLLTFATLAGASAWCLVRAVGWLAS